MRKKPSIALPLSMIFTLFLGEIHGFFGSPYLDERAWFLFINLKQDVQWYIKDSAEAVTWLVFLFVWWCRERRRSHFWANFILAFFIFRIIDLTLYWANHRHAGWLYLISYSSIIIWGVVMYGKYRK